MKTVNFKFDYINSFNGFTSESAKEDLDVIIRNETTLDYVGEVVQKTRKLEKVAKLSDSLNGLINWCTSFVENVSMASFGYNTYSSSSSLLFQIVRNGRYINSEIFLTSKEDVEDSIAVMITSGGCTNEYAKVLSEIASPLKYGARKIKFSDEENNEGFKFPTIKSMYYWLVAVYGFEKYVEKSYIDKTYKKLVEATRDFKFHIYSAKDCMAELACGVARVTSSTSCMTKGNLYEALRYFNYKFDYCYGAREDNDTYWLHPFMGYETGSNEMLLISEHDPSTIAEQVWEKSPFILRTMVDHKGNYVKWYGACGKVSTLNLESELARNYCYHVDDVEFEIKAYFDTDGNRVAPFVDQYNKTNNTLELISEGLHDDKGYYDLYVASDEDDIDGPYYYKVNHHDGYVEKNCKDGECMIDGDYYPLDELVYISHIDGYIHERYTDGDGEPDAYELLDYILNR